MKSVRFYAPALIAFRTLVVTALCFIGLASLLNADAESWIELLQTEGLESFREPTAKWTVVSWASMESGNQKKISTEPGKGVIYNGGKTMNNGVVVHENVELTGPTRSAAFKDEKSLGPLMLQGDHGPVAYRNLRIKHLKDTGR